LAIFCIKFGNKKGTREMSRPVCSECLCVIDETGCGCVQPIEPFTNHEQGEKMNANELADGLERFESFNGDVFFGTCAVMLRQQQERIKQLEETQEYLYKTHDADKAEIEALKSVVYWLKENRPEVWQDIQKWRKQWLAWLKKAWRKAQEK